jgi:hypothetical protein
MINGDIRNEFADATCDIHLKKETHIRKILTPRVPF